MAEVEQSAPSVVWNCQASAGEAPLTVGQKFNLSCNGEAVPWIMNSKSAELRLEPPQENPYALHLLQVGQLSEHEGQFTVTTYVAPEQGSLVAKGFSLSDGVHRVALAPLQLQVKSVITPEKNPERKPYGGIEPMKMVYPLWLWLICAVVVLSLGALFIRVFVRQRQHKQFLDELQKKSTALTPYNQFNKDLRGLSRLLVVGPESPWSAQRAQEYLSRLREVFFLYLSREYRIPVLKWPERQVFSSLEKTSPAQFQHFEKELRLVFRELQTAGRNTQKVTLADALQLLELCRQAVEKISKERS